MKLRLTDLSDKALFIDLEYLAMTYGLAGLARADIIHETTDEFLTALEDIVPEELGGEG